MKTRNLIALLSALLLIPALALAGGQGGHGDHGDHAEEATVNNAVAHFAAIGDALAGDSVEGIPMHAGGILAIMDAHMAEGGEHYEKMKMHAEDDAHAGMKDMKSADHESHDMKDMDGKMDMAAMHESMRAALTTLAAKDTELDAAREAFKALGANFVPMAQKMYKKSELDPQWAVMGCPMMKAEWIQVDGKVANPFYGSEMLSCGNKVSDLAAATGEGHDMKDMQGEMHGDMDHEGHDMKGMKKDDAKEGEHGEHHGG
jgi:hypothetical protein